ncbi:MAG: protein phosphatase 2C domain-containing protein, partial [Candidatus Latescibacterota bacterium]
MNVEKAQTLISDPAHHLQWKVSATSVCGSSHEKLGTPCQDASFWMTQENNILIAAVADGAGSASHSDIGAQIAVQTAVETLSTEPDLDNRLSTDCNTFKTILTHALKTALKAIKKEAKTQGIKPRELASTLITLIAT